MRSNNKFAKAVRRKGAIERLEKNIADYVTLMKETKDKDTLKKYEQKKSQVIYSDDRSGLSWIINYSLLVKSHLGNSPASPGC